jgi:single-strand DNA-binding protein
MAHDLNKALLIGNLTHDPELRSTSSGRHVCGFRVATKRVWTTESGEKKEQTQYHRIVAWGQLGELCAKYLRKGRRVYVEGRLVNREYDKDGEKRTTTEVVIDDMILLDAKPSETPGPSTPAARAADPDAETLADEVPF